MRGRQDDDESGDGVLEDKVSRDGCGNVMWIPWVPIVQSRYDCASSKSVSSEILGTSGR